MTAQTLEVRRAAATPTLMLLAFGAAVAMRVAVAGPAGAGSIRAGLLFALALVVLAVVGRAGVRVGARAVVAGLAGAAILTLPPLLLHGAGTTLPVGGYAGWAAATAVVATAEEAFLRGALFDAVTRMHSADAAVVVGAVAFAALHVPLYGWRALPLDLAVGLVLGALRLLTGTWAAPAIAHVGADLAGWWLV